VSSAAARGALVAICWPSSSIELPGTVVRPVSCKAEIVPETVGTGRCRRAG
jgi:hypothetical protein